MKIKKISPKYRRFHSQTKELETKTNFQTS